MVYSSTVLFVDVMLALQQYMAVKYLVKVGTVGSLYVVSVTNMFFFIETNSNLLLCTYVDDSLWLLVPFVCVVTFHCFAVLDVA